jgi:hypothetical protein
VSSVGVAATVTAWATRRRAALASPSASKTAPLVWTATAPATLCPCSWRARPALGRGASLAPPSGRQHHLQAGREQPGRQRFTGQADRRRHSARVWVLCDSEIEGGHRPIGWGRSARPGALGRKWRLPTTRPRRARLIAAACLVIGDHAPPTSSGAAAREVFEQLGAVPVLARVDELERAPDTGTRRPPVTARKLDVQRLVAEGRSNREIAEALVISEKTVERHLSLPLNLRWGVQGQPSVVLAISSESVSRSAVRVLSFLALSNQGR